MRAALKRKEFAHSGTKFFLLKVTQPHPSSEKGAKFFHALVISPEGVSNYLFSNLIFKP